MNKTKTFSFDVDGVIVSWFSRLPDFLKEKGLPYKHITDLEGDNHFLPRSEIFSTDDEDICEALITEYNRSHYIAQLDLLHPEAQYYLCKLRELGELVAVTCLGTDAISHQMRVDNLNNVLGYGIFSEVHCIATGADKTPKLLELQKDRDVIFFVDDRACHTQQGLNAGISSYQYIEGILTDDIDYDLKHLNSWKEIYAAAVKHSKDYDRAIEKCASLATLTL
ncbi:hypothetical protein AB4254_08485 [Vibrio breoganii]